MIPYYPKSCKSIKLPPCIQHPRRNLLRALADSLLYAKEAAEVVRAEYYCVGENFQSQLYKRTIDFVLVICCCLWLGLMMLSNPQRRETLGDE